jgi:hypothetical protein
VLFYGVVNELSNEVLELFVERREAERVVENWDRDEPDEAGVLKVRPIEFEASSNLACGVPG